MKVNNNNTKIIKANEWHELKKTVSELNKLMNKIVDKDKNPISQEVLRKQTYYGTILDLSNLIQKQISSIDDEVGVSSKDNSELEKIMGYDEEGSNPLWKVMERVDGTN